MLGVGVKCDVTWVFSICTTQEHKEKERKKEAHQGCYTHKGRSLSCLSCPTKIVIWGETVRNVRWNIVGILDVCRCGVKKKGGGWVLRMLG